jgi:hypothetical protein
MQDFVQRTQETQKFIDAVVASLPTGEVLTKARDLRDALHTEASGLRTWCNEASVRRPVDPLDVVVTAMQHRINRVSRARWAGRAPITLTGRSPDEVVAATARVEALERRQP